MKRTVLLVLCFMSVFTGLFADGKGLIPVPDRLLQSLPPAIISGADNGFKLPASLDIGSAVLIARDQGSLPNCSSWASCEELTRIERIRNNWPVGRNSTYFNPIFLFNQVGSERGSSIYANLNALVNGGCALYSTFSELNDYHIQPSESARRQATRYRIEEFRTISVNVDSIKQAIARGHGVIVSFLVSDAFASYSGGIYKPGGQDGVERRHSMLIVAYNDYEKIFKILNSWGPSWGNHQGYIFISYDDVSTLIREAYIVIPKATLPTTAVPPSHVQAGKGANKNKVVVTFKQNGADEYELFRCGDNEFYTSIGKTSKSYFEDNTVSPNTKYFYFVAAHNKDSNGEYMMSELSLASEGFSSDSATEDPGIPGEFSVRRQGKTVIAQWRAVEGDNIVYQVYQFDDDIDEYVLVGETSETTLRIPLSARITSPVMTFFVLAKNNYGGQGLPSEPAALTFESNEWKKTDEQEDQRFGKPKGIYRGGYYHFPVARFREVEKRAMEHLKVQKEQFDQNAKKQKDRAMINSQNQRNEFLNKVQSMNERLQGGK